MVTATVAVLSHGPEATAIGADPPLRFVAAASEVTIERREGEPVLLDAGTYVVAGSDPFEVHAKRASYTEPIVAKQMVGRGGQRREITLPAGLLTNFTGLPAFTHLTLIDAAGNTVIAHDETFCPNGEGVRVRPDAPDVSPYPRECAWFTPFALGSVWGIQAGWGVPTTPPEWAGSAVNIEDGTYTAVVSINQPYRDLFGFSAGQWSVTVQVTIRSVTVAEHPNILREPNGPTAAGKPAPRPVKPAAQRPTGKPNAPIGPKPDLRSLPAFDVGIVHHGSDHPQQLAASEESDYLAFSATVWVAGTSPLVVDGFRRSGDDVMDAFQYFYDANGRQTGYAPVGTMQWDARDGHNHWHFTDFAQYRLLDATKTTAVRSAKQAFCLANTDPVDYTLPYANWRPDNTDLHTSCGSGSSLAVRQVLDVGNGDTYYQFLPGQSFDVTNLANGTYYIEVAANPERNLHEQSTDNNTSHRMVILGGTPGARTVQVPPHGLIDRY